MPKPYEPISTNDLLDLLGISRRTLYDLAHREIVVRTGQNNFDLKASVRGYTAFLREGASARGASSLGLSVERERLVREQADQAAIKNAQSRGALLDAKQVEYAWATILRDVRAACLALPARIQQRLGKLTAHDVAEIDREVRDCLERLADDEL
jgi:phage terminase Nu1 subunit (DNA packaging protein)